MTRDQRFNRRRFVYGSAAVAGSIAGVPTASGLAQTPLPTVPGSFQEAPLLAEQTATGALPAVVERLPEAPVVLQGVEGIGTYGGDWNTATTNPGGSGYELRTMASEHLVRWKPGVIQFTAEDVVPNVAERYEIGADGAEYTFFLRRGMKWSDGEPFTSADLMFWYQDVVMNEEISPVVPSWLRVNNEPVVIEAPDEYTVVFRFAGPNGLFLQRLCTFQGEQMTAMPAHYLRQFHKTHNPEVVQLAEQEELPDWNALFFGRAAWRENAELPVLFAWQMTTPVGANPQQFIATRNPYYWKVDTEGNQLPYLDRVIYRVITKPEVMLLQALNGEIDLVTDYINELRNKPLYFDNQEAGGFRIFDVTYSQQGRTVLSFNLTHPTPVKREIFANKDFRIGMSHALDRQAIIDTVYVGQGEPFQVGPRPESPMYNERLARQYTEYDVDLANQHLDRVMPNKNGDGIRLQSDGEPFFVQVEFAPEFRAEWSAILELAVGYWQAVGVDVRAKAEERSLLYERKAGNQCEATIWEGEGGLEALLDPRWYFPYSGESNYAIPWGNWFLQGGLTGEVDLESAEMALEVPPEAAQQQMGLYSQIESSIDTDEQIQLMNQILEIAADEFYCLGFSLPIQGYGVATNTFHNVPEPMLYAWLSLSPSNSNPSLYFETPA